MILRCIAIACIATAALPAGEPPAVQPQVGLSSVMLLEKPLDWSGKIDGFIKVENSEVIMHFSIDEIVAVHRFLKDTAPQTVIVLNRPLVMGRSDTFLLIPEQVMKFEKVLNFVDSVRKSRATAK